MTLYELTGHYGALFAALDQAEEPEEQAKLLAEIDRVNQGIGDKAEAYTRAMLNISADINAMVVEINRLAHRRKALESRIESLKSHLMSAMKVAGKNKLSTSIGTWSLAVNPPSVEVTDLEKVPKEFLVPQPPKVDARKVLAEYKATGEIFDGIEIRRKESMRLR